MRARLAPPVALTNAEAVILRGAGDRRPVGESLELETKLEPSDPKSTERRHAEREGDREREELTLGETTVRRQAESNLPTPCTC